MIEVVKYICEGDSKAVRNFFVASDDLRVTDHINRYYWRPIHYAAIRNELEIVRMLVNEFECNPDLSTINGWTPLMMIVTKADPRLVPMAELLMQLGADPLLSTKITNHTSAYDMSIDYKEENPEMFKALKRVVDRPKKWR